MKLALPFPDSRLLPNRKTDRWTKAAVTKGSRTEAFYIAAHARNAAAWNQTGPWIRFDRCKMTYTFIPKTRKVADCDSLVRACKPFIDGIVDAGILSGDGWDVIVERTQRLGQPDKSNPRTELEIEPL